MLQNRYDTSGILRAGLCILKVTKMLYNANFAPVIELLTVFLMVSNGQIKFIARFKLHWMRQVDTRQYGERGPDMFDLQNHTSEDSFAWLRVDCDCEVAMRSNWCFSGGSRLFNMAASTAHEYHIGFCNSWMSVWNTTVILLSTSALVAFAVCRHVGCSVLDFLLPTSII